MRRGLGWAAVVLGSLVAVAAAVVAVAFGPDDRIATGPHRFSSTGAAVVTAPAALAYSGPTVEVTAQAAGRPVFIGVANAVDVKDYIGGTAYTRIDDIDLPWDTTTSTVNGDDDLAAVPGETDFWLAKASGEETATLRFRLPDSPVDLVVMDAEAAPDLDVEITAAVVQDGAFVGALAVVLVAAGVVVAGILVLRSRPRTSRRGSRLGHRTGEGFRRAAVRRPRRADERAAPTEPAAPPEPDTPTGVGR